jgi:hypothetical protein
MFLKFQYCKDLKNKAITCCCDCGQNLLITPTGVDIIWPIYSETKHDKNNNAPKYFGENTPL